ncbi:unnamed protein product [Meloidogyne enterolobii]|uniref:Uncharacterized protein n=1 Tax=Meloidogyne enterolobii TaxID=390850 RepID=A0ACB0XTN1_MELEN
MLEKNINTMMMGRLSAEFESAITTVNEREKKIFRTRNVLLSSKILNILNKINTPVINTPRISKLIQMLSSKLVAIFQISCK